MNSPMQKLERAAGHRLLQTATLVLALAQSAHAEDPLQPYEMMVISDAANGKLVMQGQYESSIHRNLERSHPDEQFAANTNLCVAFTLTRRFDEATQACDAAIDINATEQDLQDRAIIVPLNARDISNTRRAIAYSNRGVLRMATGDREAALEDFTLAVSLDVPVDAARSNLARLTTRQVSQAR